MIRGFLPPLSLTRPLTWLLPIAALFWFVLEMIAWSLDFAPKHVGQRDACVLLICFIYGAYRGVSNHPYYRDGYGRWLATTPWRLGKPLPLGPLQLVWQDAVLLAVFALGMHGSTWDRSWLVIAGLAGYGVTIALSMRATGLVWHAYGVLFLIALIVRLQPWPVVCLMAVIGLVAALHYCVNEQLRRFPWELQFDPFAGFREGHTPENGKRLHGWPHSLLAPGVSRKSGISYPDAIAISLLLGWWSYAVLAHRPRVEPNGLEIAAILIVAVPCCVFRLVRYLEFHRPPQTRLGMLSQRRLIAPRFDIVFLAPLLAAAVAATAIGVQLQLNLAAAFAPFIAPTAIAAIVAITLGMGPTYQHWSLTGDHRIVMGSPGPFVKEI